MHVTITPLNLVSSNRNWKKLFHWVWTILNWFAKDLIWNGKIVIIIGTSLISIDLIWKRSNFLLETFHLFWKLFQMKWKRFHLILKRYKSNCIFNWQLLRLLWSYISKTFCRIYAEYFPLFLDSTVRRYRKQDKKRSYN